VVLLAAGHYLERRLVGVALIAFLAFSIPHSVFHFLNLGPYSTADMVGNVLGLAATVAVPLWLLYLLLARRDPAPGLDRRDGARGGPAG
jgi:hypothetical protein